MNQEAIRIMREEEEIMLDIVKNAKKAEHDCVMKPIGLEAARILVDLLRIEAMLPEEYDPYAQ